MAGGDLFLHLTPDKVLDAVEVCGLRATGRALALNSYENRVYDVEMEDGSHRVMKFYRPGRWSEEALADEHRLLRELADEGMPVAAAEVLRPGAPHPTVGTIETGADSIRYAAFPKVRGRQLQPDEVSADELLRIGRLIGRLHNVGAAAPALHRPRFSPVLSEEIGFLCDRHVPLELAGRFRRAAEAIERAAAPLADLPVQRIHGDCHLGNLVYTTSGPCFVDFDDCCMGPPVQDLWLLAGGDGERLEALCAGYEELRALDRGSLRLVEALRGLRMVRYVAWIGHRYHDPAFQRAFPTYEEGRFWAREVEDLELQIPRLALSQVLRSS